MAALELLKLSSILLAVTNIALQAKLKLVRDILLPPQIIQNKISFKVIVRAILLTKNDVLSNLSSMRMTMILIPMLMLLMLMAMLLMLMAMFLMLMVIVPVLMTMIETILTLHLPILAAPVERIVVAWQRLHCFWLLCNHPEDQFEDKLSLLVLIAPEEILDGEDQSRKLGGEVLAVFGVGFAAWDVLKVELGSTIAAKDVIWVLDSE